MDADSWKKREGRYKKKFSAGKKYIPKLFKGLNLPTIIEQIALLGFAGRGNHNFLGGGQVLLVWDFLEEIMVKLETKRIGKEAVPEQWPLLRTLQFVANYRNKTST